jgi:hypothetical protein
MENWANLVRKSIDAYQKAEDLKAEGNEIGSRKIAKLVKLYDNQALIALRGYYTEHLQEEGLTKDQSIRYMHLEGMILDLQARINKGSWFFSTCKDSDEKMRYHRGILSFERKMEGLMIAKSILDEKIVKVVA